MRQTLALAAAILLCLTSRAQAILFINVGDHNYPPGTGVVIIPIVVTGTDLVHGSEISVQLGGTPSAFAPLGAAPPITYQGSEQYNQPTPGAGDPLISPSMWDAHANSWFDGTDGNFDDIPSIPGSPGYGTAGSEGTWFFGGVVFGAINTGRGLINPNNGLEVNLVVNLTGFGPGTWPLRLFGGVSGATDFVNLDAKFVPTTIVDGSVTVTPEPASVVLGLFAAAGLAVVANRGCRKR